MAFRRRYHRRYSRRRFRRAERQRLVLPVGTLSSESANGSWILWQNLRSNSGSIIGPIGNSAGGVGAISQEPVSQWIGKIKLDFFTCPSGVRFLLVYVPAANRAFAGGTAQAANQLVPSAQWEVVSGGIAASIYEPNQHVMGYGMVTAERHGFYFRKMRRLYSGDSVMLLVHGSGDEQYGEVGLQVSFSIR